MSVIEYILWPFGWIMRTAYNLTGSYALALLAFAIIMKVVMIPFGIKQQKNMVKQAKLAPKEMAIRKKYAGRNDQATQQKMMMEIQEMQKSEGFSPLGGCLPLLLQMPIIMILYRIVYMPLTYISQFSTDVITKMQEVAAAANPDFKWGQVELQLLNFFEGDKNIFNGVEGFAADRLPNTKLFGIFDLTATPNFNENLLLCLIPVLVFVTTFLSMKLMRKFTYQPPQAAQQGQGCSNGIMDLAMPLFSFALSFSLSASIGVYWIYQTALGFAQQVILSKVMPTPKYTEDDFKKAEKEMGVHDRQVKKQQTKVRSLHHIDDDDEDELPPPQRRARGEHVPEDDEKSDREPDGKSILEKAPLNDESDKGRR